MIVYWQAAAAVLLLFLFGGQQPACLARLELHRSLLSKSVLLNMTGNKKNLGAATGGDRNLILKKGKKVAASLLKNYLTDNQKSPDGKKSRQKHLPMKVMAPLLKDTNRRKLVKVAWKTLNFAKKHPKHIMKREVIPHIDQKYRKHITDHCNDLHSYYLPALDECYRIYQTSRNYTNTNYAGTWSRLTNGMTQNDYAYKCRVLYHGKLLDVQKTAIIEKIKLVKQMALHFYQITGQREGIRVGFMTKHNNKLMTQSGTLYDKPDGIHLKMHPVEPCNHVCCVVMRPDEKNSVELEQTSCNDADVGNFICQKQGNKQQV